VQLVVIRKKVAIPKAEVLCPDDAEEAEKILRGVSRTSAAAKNSRRLALIRGWKSLRLHRKTFADNHRRRFLPVVQEREVVGGVVGESGKFGDLESRKTAQEQPKERGEDEL